MKTIFNLMRTELKILLCSPISWLILIVFAVQTGITFTSNFIGILTAESMGMPLQAITISLMGGDNGLMLSMLSHLYLYIPLLTMGLMSKELSTGSIKLLYSSPISNLQIILAKYFSTLVFGLILMGILLIPIIYTSITVSNADISMMLTALLGVFLTISSYAAIGLFMSTITKYQVVAAIGTLAILAILNFIGTMGQDINIVRDITYWISIRGRSMVFINGMICSKDVLYFLIVNSVFITLSVIVLRSQRLKQSTIKQCAHVLAVLAVAICLGYISNRPYFTVYHDSTDNNLNTLSKGSQEVLKKLPGKLKIVSYVNFLDDTWRYCPIGARISDMKHFERYIRFKPDLQLEYVYYYGKGTNKFIDRQFPNMSIHDKMLHQAKINDIDTSIFKTEAQVAQMEDISAENGRFVRVVTYENGKKVYIRKYDDPYVNPSESEMSSILKTLTDKSPIIAFATGNGERSCSDNGPKGYGYVQDKSLRKSLVNQGYTVKELSLENPISDDVDLMIIADSKKPYSQIEIDNFQDYVERGGNLFILGDVNRQEVMNPLLEKIGLKFGDGIIVSASKQHLSNLIPSYFTVESEYFSPMYPFFASQGMNIVCSSAVPIEILDNIKFNVFHMLSTPMQGYWVEKETTDFINEKPTINENIGEQEGAQSMMVALTRLMNKKEQRIFVMGDADCINRDELNKKRPGLGGNNNILMENIISSLTYDQYPVDASIEASTDTSLKVKIKSAPIMKIVFIGIIPLLLLLLGGLLIIKRKRR